MIEIRHGDKIGKFKFPAGSSDASVHAAICRKFSLASSTELELTDAEEVDYPVSSALLGGSYVMTATEPTEGKGTWHCALPCLALPCLAFDTDLTQT